MKCRRSAPIASNANQLIWWQLLAQPFNTIVNIPRSVYAASPKMGHTGFHTLEYLKFETTDQPVCKQEESYFG
jgi:hypothetical protein